MGTIFTDGGSGWSTSAGSNTTVDGVSIAEGMSPANLNNSDRGMMAVIRQTFSSLLANFFADPVTNPLGLAHGGTGAGSAGAALTSLGALADTYRDAAITTKTVAFTFADADRGTTLRYTGGAAAATINPFGTTPINVGGIILVRVAHNATGALTITRGAGVSLRIAGQTTDQNVVVAVGGYCQLLQEATNVWICAGAGIS